MLTVVVVRMLTNALFSTKTNAIFIQQKRPRRSEANFQFSTFNFQFNHHNQYPNRALISYVQFSMAIRCSVLGGSAQVLHYQTQNLFRSHCILRLPNRSIHHKLILPILRCRLACPLHLTSHNIHPSCPSPGIR